MGNSHKTPSGWVHIKLGEYLTEIGKRNATSGDNGIPVLSVTNRPGFMLSEEHFDKKVFSKDLSNYKVIHKGQFAYNPSRVNVGSIARLTEFDKGLLSPMYVAFEVKDGLDGVYLDYWIKSPRFRNLVKASTQGSVRNSLNFSALADFPFDLPPTQEQVIIIAILSLVDSVINQTKAIIKQSQVLKKGLMQDLFTGGIPGRHKKFKQTKIGEIPENWNVYNLIDLCSSAPQYGAGASGKEFVSGLPRYVRITDLTDEGALVEENKKGIDPKQAEDYMLAEGDFLFARSGATVGKTYLYNPEDGLCAFAGYLIKFKPDSQKLLPKFLFYFTHHGYYYKWVKDMLRAGAQPNINATEYSKLLIPTPDIAEQREIVNALDEVNARINTEQDLLGELAMARASLMQVLLTGEIRAKDKR